jgi:hypothetical protein
LVYKDKDIEQITELYFGYMVDDIEKGKFTVNQFLEGIIEVGKSCGWFPKYCQIVEITVENAREEKIRDSYRPEKYQLTEGQKLGARECKKYFSEIKEILK